MNICLLMMGGSGVRFGADRPKQFVEINNKPLFYYILEGLSSSECINRIVVVTHSDWIEYVHEWSSKIEVEKIYGIVPGGSTRSESVKNGLKKIQEIASAKDIVLIHDATHPYVDKVGMEELITAVKENGAATMVQRQYDTCYTIDEDDTIVKVTPRQFVVSGASPEGFLFKDIYNIYMNASEEEFNSMTSAGAIALAHGIKMKAITLHTLNLKITYPDDMKLFQTAPEFFFN